MDNLTRRGFIGAAAAAAPLAAQGPTALLPRPATEFAFNMVGGKPIMLSSYKGKITLVSFLVST